MSADEEPPVDPLPALLANIDQALSMAGELARLARGYYDAFKHAGFSDAQAVYLTACQLHGDPGDAPS